MEAFRNSYFNVNFSRDVDYLNKTSAMSVDYLIDILLFTYLLLHILSIMNIVFDYLYVLFLQRLEFYAVYVEDIFRLTVLLEILRDKY